MKATVQFSVSEVKMLAIFLAQLTREGVTFEVKTIGGGWNVVLTGGY